MKRDRILDIVKKYIENEPTKKFIPGETRIWASGATWDADDVASLVDVALDRWYGGKVAHEFERFMATVIGQRYVTLCNSGSSANLLALSCLTSKRLKERALKKGDEVITIAAGFPTTVNPIIQNGLIPVFIDINLPGYNALPNAVSEAISDKTKAIMIAHTLGNPYRAKEIREIADQNRLFIIGDNCDSLGAEHHGKPLPYWADISTFSFFPAHIISTGEGGAVSTNDSLLDSIIRSFRDWGRSCWCAVGKDNTCGKRYEWQLGDLPFGFDHKYIYSEIGYNFKATDLQAALGVSQIKKLPKFVETRRDNWKFYREHLNEFNEHLIMPEPTAYSKPSWFGFAISIKEKSPFTRTDLISFLDQNKIDSRMLFAGNIVRHPAYMDIRHRVSGTLHKSDFVTKNTFWIGVAPVVTRPMQNYVVEKFAEFMKRYK